MEETSVRIKHMCGSATCWHQAPMAGWPRSCGVFRENVSHSPGLLFQGLTLLTPGMVTSRHLTPRRLSTKLVAGGLLLAVRPRAALQGGLKPGLDCAATSGRLQVGEEDKGVFTAVRAFLALGSFFRIRMLF